MFLEAPEVSGDPFSVFCPCFKNGLLSINIDHLLTAKLRFAFATWGIWVPDLNFCERFFGTCPIKYFLTFCCYIDGNWCRAWSRARRWLWGGGSLVRHSAILSGNWVVVSLCSFRFPRWCAPSNFHDGNKITTLVPNWFWFRHDRVKKC